MTLSGLKWPPTQESKGHFEESGRSIFIGGISLDLLPTILQESKNGYRYPERKGHRPIIICPVSDLMFCNCFSFFSNSEVLFQVIMLSFCRTTLPKTSIAPSRRPSQKEITSSNPPMIQVLRKFQGVYLFSWVLKVNLGGTFFPIWGIGSTNVFAETVANGLGLNRCKALKVLITSSPSKGPMFFVFFWNATKVCEFCKGKFLRFFLRKIQDTYSCSYDYSPWKLT